MRKIEKKKLSRNAIVMIVLASVLLLVIAAAIIFTVIANLKAANDAKAELPDIREELGESIYINSALAYPRLEESEILSILVKNKEGTFDMIRYPDDNSSFMLGYDLGNGQNTVYLPPITNAEGEFDYESLYAVEESDGYGTMYMLSYLCSAVGTPYFRVRIDLPTGTDAESLAKKQSMLEEYGLAGEGVSRVSFEYGDRDKSGKITERGQHHVEIGERALNGKGYYYRVDGRNCIYYTDSDYFDYAMKGFNAFVKGMLVAEGLPGDSSYGPLLTTDYKQWLNTIHEDGAVVDGSNVIGKGSILTPIKESADYDPTKYPDGYSHDDGRELSVDISSLKGGINYDRLKQMLVGKKVGHYTDSPLLVTFILELPASGDMLIDFGDKSSLTYTYTVTAIESVLNYTDGNTEWENDAPGTVVAADSLIRVSYSYKIDGVAQNTVPRHAIIDLSSDKLDALVKAELTGATVGTLATPVEFDITYGKDGSGALCSVEELIIEDVIRVYNDKGQTVEKITGDSIVFIRYHEKIDGVVGKTETASVKISDLKAGTKWAPLKDVLLDIGTRASGINRTAYSSTYYYEQLRDFKTYSFEKIDGFITSELVVSFRFANASERDPYYGSSLYENTLSGKQSLYGMNSNVCQTVVKILGGVGETTTVTEGLAGETVAVGLTHEIMLEKDLYDYRIYFEMPRDIFDASVGTAEDSSDALSDYDWHGTLGFNLYVSKKQPGGYRYIGSDMYDLVAKVEGDSFDFLDYSFVEFWTRSNLVLIDAANLASLEVDFFMEDVYGEYDFEIDCKTVYVGMYDGEIISSYEKFDGAQAQDKYFIYITEGEGSMTTTALSKYLKDKGKNKASVTDLYNTVMGGGKELFLPNSIETVGASNFALAFQVAQLTYYQGTLTEEEQAKAFEGDKLMSFKFKLKGRNASAFYYVYDFYRCDDRKVMVSMYQANEDGEAVSTAVSDFYLSTFSFKKLVGAYLSLLNAKDVDGDVAYPY